MNRYFDLHFNRNIVTIYPGEFWVSSEQEMISTILGSCVSIVLFDPVAVVGGMNHFMLAKDTQISPQNQNETLGRYGEYAVEMLISEMEKKGAVLNRCYAKVFGGSNIFNTETHSDKDLVGDTNVKFAFDYLKLKNIKIKSSDTGGNLPRKIFFDPTTSKIYLKRINNRATDDEQIKSSERKFIEYLAELNRLSKKK